ncbi:MAG: ATP cone domain-containing protein [Nitrososphaera sp.]
MEQPSFDYQKDSKKGGLLESASKRVRMIFSVMASPNRIDILRILNAKGPLTYSELKALAGFKSKKESGKFAYHLRKLLRQLLVALNKTERRYTITNLGKLVLGLARQIEERSIIESGKMYVRTNKQTIEEFNSHKIIQSLVREANLPLEQAHKITEEVENKIYRFQTTYLTSSLIRETVNSILIEHGYEEYRNKLARLGLPSSDIAQMLSQEDPCRNGIERVMTRAAGAVFSEYLLFNTLPKDIADMHLAGEINISNTSVWGLLPDTIFIDLSELEEGLDLKGKFLSMSRIPPIRNSDDAVATLPAMVSLLSREASTEVVLEGFVPKLINNLNDPERIASGFGRALLASSGAPSYTAGMPVITIVIPADNLDDPQLNALLEGYRRYLNNTPMPRFGLALIGKVRGCIDHITTVVRSGGIISIGNNIVRANNGIKKADVKTTAAMSLRKKIVVDNIKKGMMPAFASASQLMQLSTASIAVNLTGTRESVYNILGESSDEVLQKVIKTAAEVTNGQGKQLGEEGAGIAMVSDDSGTRFATLDSEKYGKVSLLQSQNTTSYSQGMTLDGRDILNDPGTSIQECLAIDKLLNGGFAASLDLTNLSSDEMKNAIESAVQELPFLRLSIGFAVCTTCGQRSKGGVGICEFCKSPHKVPLYL